MNKVLLGVLLGAALGAVDGLTAWLTPAVRPYMIGIVIGSTVKGIIAGVAAGWFARKVQSVPGGIVFGFLVGLLLAFGVAAMPSETGEHYYFEIMLPGSIVGAILGWATQRYGRPAASARPAATAAALALALLVPLQAYADSERVTAAEALSALKTLAGKWDARVMKEDGPQAAVEYRVTSGGTAVMETLFRGTPHEMITVYALEGEELIAQHYCAMGNQPKLRLDRAKSNRSELVFAFDEVAGKHDDHLHDGWIRLQGADRFEASWNFKASGPKRFWAARTK